MVASSTLEMDIFRRQFQQHKTLVGHSDANGEVESQKSEFERAPLFGSDVVLQQDCLPSAQYGLLGEEKAHHHGTLSTKTPGQEPNLIYANTNEPWSAFICGSQGSGKSHTLANLLENSILPVDLVAGQNAKPLAAIAFHYDQFTSWSATQHCELAYLASAGIKVRILASPSNLGNMKKLYSNMPGLAESSQPEVVPFMLRETDLNIENMMTLMNVRENDATPLYLAIIWEILRRMAAVSTNRRGIDYLEFRRQINAQGFQMGQTTMLNMRLNLLDSLLDTTTRSKTEEVIWSFPPGTLTIIDLSSPFISVGDACALFSISLNLFMAGRGKAGRVLVLDEAHKFLTTTGEAEILTNSIMAIIRQQRHLATRVMIATQEPTLDHRLLDLCNVVIVHRFSSLAWFSELQSHLAGSRRGVDKASTLDEIFRTIVGLKTGTALLFSPTSVLHMGQYEEHADEAVLQIPAPSRLKDGYVEVRIRARITQDGGRSIVAADGSDEPGDEGSGDPGDNETSSTVAGNGDTSSLTNDSSSRSQGVSLPPAKISSHQAHMRSKGPPLPALKTPAQPPIAEGIKQLIHEAIDSRIAKGESKAAITPPVVLREVAKKLELGYKAFKKAYKYKKLAAMVDNHNK